VPTRLFVVRQLLDGEVVCSNCGLAVGEPRKPCPQCGRLERTFSKHFEATLTMSASLSTRVIASAVAGYFAGQVMVDPPRPHDALHPQHQHGDVVGAVFYGTIAVGAFIATGRRGFRFLKRI
jgi:hypothetical protein